MEKIIKRYSNRKLYDSDIASYVTLADVCKYIKEGYKIKVLAHSSAEDLTNITLLSALRADSESEYVTNLIHTIIRGGVNE